MRRVCSSTHTHRLGGGDESKTSEGYGDQTCTHLSTDNSHSSAHAPKPPPANQCATLAIPGIPPWQQVCDTLGLPSPPAPQSAQSAAQNAVLLESLRGRSREGVFHSKQSCVPKELAAKDATTHMFLANLPQWPCDSCGSGFRDLALVLAAHSPAYQPPSTTNAVPPRPPAAGPAAGSSAAPACASTLRTHPQPQPPRPLGCRGAHVSGLPPRTRKPPPLSEPERAEPACLGARWQVTDAPLLPRDRAALAGANRCVMLEIRDLQRHWPDVGASRNHLQLLLEHCVQLGEVLLLCERLHHRLHRRRVSATAIALAAPITL